MVRCSDTNVKLTTYIREICWVDESNQVAEQRGSVSKQEVEHDKTESNCETRKMRAWGGVWGRRRGYPVIIQTLLKVSSRDRRPTGTGFRTKLKPKHKQKRLLSFQNSPISDSAYKMKAIRVQRKFQGSRLLKVTFIFFYQQFIF